MFSIVPRVPKSAGRGGLPDEEPRPDRARGALGTFTRRGFVAIAWLGAGLYGIRVMTLGGRSTSGDNDPAPTETSMAHFRRLLDRSQRTANGRRVWTQEDHQALWVDLHAGLKALNRELSGSRINPSGSREL